MPNVTLPTMLRMSREKLSTILLAETTAATVAVIDVRDSDHVGGHIVGSRHVPSDTLSWAAPELARTLKNCEKVVFHCALSQQRGPSAALKYLRERERLLGSDSIQRGNTSYVAESPEQGKQEVYVLDGGFVKWQEKFGEDERLTANYDKELWADGY